MEVAAWACSTCREGICSELGSEGCNILLGVPGQKAAWEPLATRTGWERAALGSANGRPAAAGSCEGANGWARLLWVRRMAALCNLGVHDWSALGSELMHEIGHACCWFVCWRQIFFCLATMSSLPRESCLRGLGAEFYSVGLIQSGCFHKMGHGFQPETSNVFSGFALLLCAPAFRVHEFFPRV